MTKIPSLSIIVICHKHDFFLTKICVASIRYYYPSVPIYIVKDMINGSFSSILLERYFNVKPLHLDTDIFGWGNAKLFLIATSKLAGQKFLVLDSDTVFIGKVLDKLNPFIQKNDFIVSSEYHNKPGQEGFKNWYYDINWVQKELPKFRYPGFTFNSGQMVITPGIIRFSDYLPYFNNNKYPYWTQKYAQHFTSDQSLLNILLPLYEQQKQITLHHVRFMQWSETKFVKQRITLKDIVNGRYMYVVHWAGSLKSHDIRKMTRGDILSFFQKQYYSKLPLGLLISHIKRVYQALFI